MKQRYDQDQRSDAIQDAWSAAWGDPALQDLGRRLESYGLPAEQAATVVEQTWLFYSYEALPLLGERVPMGIATRTGERPTVWLYLPFRVDDVPFLPRDEPRFQELNRLFVRRFEEPLAVYVALDLEPVFVSFRPDTSDSHATQRFEARVRHAANRKSMDFLGVFVDDLIVELRTVMDEDAVSPWLDTPNTLFGGRRPIEFLDDPRDHQLRDVITRAKFNLSAA